jgi:hypothetical protein
MHCAHVCVFTYVSQFRTVCVSAIQHQKCSESDQSILNIWYTCTNFAPLIWNYPTGLKEALVPQGI